MNFPQTVKPEQKIQLMMAVDFTSLVPGRFETAATVVDMDERPVAQMKMRGYLKPGITFKPAKIELGNFPAKTGATRTFLIHFDRRVAARLPSGLPLQIASNSSSAKVKILPPAKAIKQVIIKGNEIRFNLPYSGEPLDSDLDIRCSVSVPPGIRLGPTNAEVSVFLRGFPNFLILKDTKISVAGVAQGSMKAAEYVVVPPSAPLGKQSSARTLIKVSPSVSAVELQVKVAGKYLSARLVPVAPTSSGATTSSSPVGAGVPSAPPTQPQATGPVHPAENKVPANARSGLFWLEVTTGQGAPVGSIRGKVTVANTVAKDHLEIQVYSAVTK